MIEKPKRPKQLDVQDRQPPRTIQELVNRYDLNNEEIYDYLDILVDQLVFKPGESYSFGSIACAGHLTSSKQTIQFSIVMPKRMDNVSISSISLSGLIRHADGGYINSSDVFNLADYGTMNCAIRGNVITVTYVLTNATTFTNNCPVCVWVSGTVKFK